MNYTTEKMNYTTCEKLMRVTEKKKKESRDQCYRGGGWRAISAFAKGDVRGPTICGCCGFREISQVKRLTVPSAQKMLGQ